MADFPKIISVDDHIVEPADLWSSRLPEKYKELGPTIVRKPMPKVEFVGGNLKIKEGSESVMADWWIYEKLQRPLLRVDSAVGERQMAGLTDEQRYKVLRGNAISLFGLDFDR